MQAPRLAGAAAAPLVRGAPLLYLVAHTMSKSTAPPRRPRLLALILASALLPTPLAAGPQQHAPHVPGAELGPELYGRILSRVAAARYPELAARPEPRARDGKLRVGFVSSFLYDHTIFKIYNAWITDLTDAIETYVYYKGRSRIPRSSICATAPIISNMSPAPNSSSPRRARPTPTSSRYRAC